MIYTEIVADYKKQHQKRDDDEIEFFHSRRANFDEVLMLAGLAVNAEGKRLDHMNRLRYDALGRALTTFIANKTKLTNQKTFHGLLDTIYQTLHSKMIGNLGEMYWYDTALRIGAALELLPKHIYLHRGTRDGAKALNINVLESDKSDRLFAKVEELPDGLKDSSLAALHYESLLCIYKDKFPTAQ